MHEPGCPAVAVAVTVRDYQAQRNRLGRSFGLRFGVRPVLSHDGVANGGQDLVKKVRGWVGRRSGKMEAPGCWSELGRL